MLHKLANGKRLIVGKESTHGLMKTASKKQQLWITGADDGCSFEIPILPDLYGMTPLDYCLGLKQRKKDLNTKVFRRIMTDDDQREEDLNTQCCFRRIMTNDVINVPMA